MKKLISIFTLSFFFLLFFYLVRFPSPAIAGYDSNSITIIQTSSGNGGSTNWRVQEEYRSGGITIFGPVIRDSEPTDQWTIYNFRPNSGDKIRWHTACVDPDISANSNQTGVLRTDGILLFQTNIDAGCHIMGYNGTLYSVYAGCKNTNYATKNWGTVGANSQCPWYTNSDSYCTAAGLTGYSTNCGASYCGGTNGCTYYLKGCSGQSCSHTPYTNDTRCGGSCGAIPAPPTNRTAASSCNGSTNAQVNFEWSPIANDSSYDLRYRKSGTTTWTTITGIGTTLGGDGKVHRVVTGLSFGTQYDWEVLGHTAAGYPGPTAWSALTYVTTVSSSTCAVATATPTTAAIPPPPANRTAAASCNVTNAQVNFEWSPIANDASYELRYRKTGTTAWSGCASTATCNTITGIGTTLGGDGKVHRIVTGLSYSTGYDWQVLGHTAAGYPGPTAWSAVTNVTTVSSGSCAVATNTPAPVPLTAPAAPSFSYVCSSGSPVANLAWTAVSGASSYGIQRRHCNNTGTTCTAGWTGWTIVTGYVTTSTSITLGSQNTLYEFDLNYVKSGVTSPWSNATQKETPNCAVTATPTLVPTSAVTVNVYNDSLGNCSSTTLYTGGGSSFTLGGTSYTVSTSGTRTVSGLTANTYSIDLTNPAGYSKSSCDIDPKSRSVPPSQTVSYWIQASPPTCTSLTANPASGNPPFTSNLTANCTPPAGQTLTYNWFNDTRSWGGSIRNITTNHANTAVWDSPNPWWSPATANPSVQACTVATGVCAAVGASINIVPLYSVAGNVFLDTNKDGIKNNGEVNYTGAITVSRSPASGTVTTGGGAFSVTRLSGATYGINYTGLPAGYQMTYPLNGPPPNFSVTVGPSCSVGGSNSATCDANGNITNLNYGITNVLPWIQNEGSDIWFNSGFTNAVPAGASCGSYTSLVNPTTNTPGIVYSGNGSQDHGQGSASTTNWKVGGASVIDQSDYGKPPPNLKTSYTYLNNIISQNSITPVDLSSFGGCNKSSNTPPYNITCNTNNWSNISNGVYKADMQGGTLTLNGSGLTFPASKNFVFIVNGKLQINEEIHIPKTSTATFTTSDDIVIAEAIGTATVNSKTANIEGWFSSDKNFIVQSSTTCPTSARRLNVEGAIVTGAGGVGGKFVNQRDLCGGNASCPAFYIKERADFILNAPALFQTIRRVWQEIAP